MANEQLKRWAGRKVHLPVLHRPFMTITHGTFSCADCRHLKDLASKECGQPDFIAANGGSTIPADDLRKACSDWFEPKA